MPNASRRVVRRALPAALLVLVFAALAAGCGSSDDSTGSTGGGGSVDIVAYSTPEAVYADALEPGFEATPEGEGVSFSGSFGASGDQRRAVEAGQPASLVHFAQAIVNIRHHEQIATADFGAGIERGVQREGVRAIRRHRRNPGDRSYPESRRRRGALSRQPRQQSFSASS